MLLLTEGTTLIAKLLKMQLMEDDDEVVYSADEAEAKQKADGRPAWMIALHNSVATWLRLVPQSLTSLKRTVENIKDPMYRYFEREVNAAVKLLEIVRRDLKDTIQICKGEKKQTNVHRSIISDLAKGILPSHWRCYTVPSGCTVIQWITDFSDRIKQLQKVSTASISGGTSALKNLHVWLGGLFNPEAYITATRQYVAQANSWSLEELTMKVTIMDKDAKPEDLDECSFGVTGLKLQGAECKDSQLHLTLTISADLPVTILRWIKRTEAKSSGPEVTLPVYLNTMRRELLFTVNLPVSGQQKEHIFYERGVAVICSSSLG